MQQTEPTQNELNTGKKAIEIIEWIVKCANNDTPIILEQDWGGNSLTVVRAVLKDGVYYMTEHTHAGLDTSTIDELIDNMHSTVTGRGGLSWCSSADAER